MSPHGPGPGLPPGQKSMNFGPSLRRLLQHLRVERPWMILVVVLGAAAVSLQVLGPKLLGDATNIVFNGVVGRMLPEGITQDQAVQGLRAAGEDQVADMVSGMDVVPGQGIDFGALGTTLLTVLAVYLVSALFLWGQGLILAYVVQRTGYRLRRDVQAKIDRLSLRHLDSQARGDTLSRVTNDIDNVTQSLQQTLSQLITSTLTVLGVLGMMFYLSWQLALIALVTVPLSAVMTMAIAKRAQPEFVAQWTSTGTLGGHVEEAFTGHELVTAFNSQDSFTETFDAENDKLYRASFKAQFISGTIMPAMAFVSNLNYVLVAVVGGLRVASGALTLGEVQAFIQYSRQFSQPLAQIASMANLVQSGVASAERIFELMDAEEEIPDPAPGNAPAHLRGKVEFDDVSFRYEADTPLIEHLDLVVEPGQTVAVVGPTGAGKTTLVNLIMRFYEIDGGRILLDGVDTREMTREELRARIGMVLQDTWLFKGTIAENIAFGRTDADEQDVLAAARATGVDRFVHSLPEGYETVIDDEGGGVSTGEKQLITIARAFLSDPQILILDEATSSVDTRTEVLVQQAMGELRKGRTSFVIAHRLSTIRDADLILVMESGRIVEQGTHAGLLEAGGAYARLYESQFAAPVVEEA
ncbi:ABC transporter ATP-binding protein [Georgenia subflava]|uniref:Fatty acid ABC transporter ATP-binding/permease protein n=1 Tax=Georgenia subflava TaxID=1622177 RepID=A0A6N7EFP8_9MICO|nr:ABC transporter ATP-binding protein [Georgenia subflava]MPV35778.1 ATP-binding cassette domain-containing protein [Georgenia subflava]